MKLGNPRRKRKPWRVRTLGFSFVVIGICEAFLLVDVVADIFYIDISTSWIDHTLIELVSVITLGLALAAIGKTLRDLLREHKSYQATVRAASSQFLDIIDAKFDDWNLTASEREVALMLIKGFSVQEIGEVRNTRPGTIKSQSNSIYRKANVRGRNELIADFVEDLLGGEDLVSDSLQPPEGKPNLSSL